MDRAIVSQDEPVDGLDGMMSLCHGWVEFLPLPCYILRAGYVVYFNPVAARLHGESAPASESAPRDFLEWVHPDSRAMWLEEQQMVSLAVNLVRRFEMCLLCRDGQPLQVEATLGPVRYAGAAALILVGAEITDHVEIETILKRRNRHLTVLNRVIGSAAGNAAPSSDPSQTVASFDVQQILRVLCAELALAFQLPHVFAFSLLEEQSEAQVVAEYCGPESQSVLGLQAPLIHPAIAHLLKQQKPLLVPDVQVDNRMESLRATLALRGLRSILVAPLVGRGRVIGIVVLASCDERPYNADDMELLQSVSAAATQVLEAAWLYRQLQVHAAALEKTVAERTTELQLALQHARAADESKSQFISTVSHELRTPLTSIQLYLELLERGMAEKRDLYIASLHRETERLRSLIESILTISRLDLSKTQLSITTVDVNYLLNTLALDREALLLERGLQLRVELSAEPLFVAGDVRLLEQVITNLLTNAMNYTPAGGVVWLMSALQSARNRRWITLSVRDTGPGISPEDQAHLFERFFRGDVGRNSDAPGTGLGLAICQEIAALHHGHITVKSALGQGALFTLWLPYALA